MHLRSAKYVKVILKLSTGNRDGHNAQPVVKGRCCADCNSTIVLRKRMEILFNKIQ